MPKFSDAPLDWDEAARAFAARTGMSSQEFYALADYLRGAAFTVTRIAELQTLARVQRKLVQLIEDGGTLAEFQAWATDQAHVWTRAYTELVFRQNVFSSYNRARWEEINDPDLGEEFGWLMYDAVNDDRTRDEHAALDNMAWPKDEFPDEHWPPNGFNCRCEVRSLNDDLLDRSGARVMRGPAPEQPDEGFRTNQARDYADELEREHERIRNEF